MHFDCVCSWFELPVFQTRWRSASRRKFVASLHLLISCSWQSLSFQLRSVLERIRHESRKAITHQQPLPVGFGLRDKWKKQVSMFRLNFFNAEDLQCVGNIQNFCD